MNKKLLIAAVGAALVAGPMLAAQADTTLYGHFHMSFDNLDNDNAQYGYVASNSTRIGVKGNEDLGGGLKGIYQVESGALAADTGVSGFGGQLRNTFMGFSGSSWGTVKVGRHDTPFKDLGRKLDNFNEEVGDMRNILSGSSTGASLYDARVSNMIRYESPNMGGLTANVLHTSNTNTSGTTDTATNVGEGPTGTGKALNSLGVNWSTGPIFLGAAYQRASFTKGAATPFGATVSKDHDSAWRLAGAYTMDALMVGLIYQRLQDIYGADLKQNAMGVAASYKMANNLFKFHYMTADDFKGSDGGSDTGGKLWALGVDHVFSKTTLAYINYAQAKNDNNNNMYSVVSGNGGHGENLLPVADGKKVKGITAGMILNF